jgi:hypothetical protein
MKFMKQSAKTTLAIFASAVLFAAEKPVKMTDLPPAVQKAVHEQTEGTQVKGFTKEVEKGKTIYEVETTVNGHGRDLSFDASGNLLEIEEETTLASLPDAAKMAIEKKAVGGKITMVEAVTKGKTVTYEATITKGEKKSEFAVAGDGSPVK